MEPAASPYRPQAVQRLQSPDRLDAAVRVGDAKGWVAVGVGILGVVAALIWGFTGSIPDRVEGSMVLLRTNSVVRIDATTSGIIDEIAVEPGSTVEPGDTLMTIVDGDGATVDVTTPTDGVVQQIYVRAGASVAPGTDLAALLDPDLDEDLTGVAYVGPQDAVTLRAGQPVTIQPLTVDASEFGALLGTISFVGDVPSSPNAIGFNVENEPLAELLAAGTGGVPYLVRVELGDPLTWTNDDAPDIRLRDGTLSSFSVVVDEDRPIDLLFGG